jgi:hypothetical protein
MIRALIKWLTGGVLDRVLDTVEKRIDSQTDRERIKADLIKTHLQTRADFMNAGGFWLMLIFAVPFGVWWAMVIYDTTFGCADCLLANDWTVAALEPPLDEWAGWIMLSIFGVVGVSKLRK